MPQVEQGLTDRTEQDDNAREKVRSEAFKQLEWLLRFVEEEQFQGETSVKVSSAHGIPRTVKIEIDGKRQSEQ